MSFKRINSHARWVSYRDKMAKLFEPLIRVRVADLKEKDFAEYLLNGEHDKFRLRIGALADVDFLIPEKAANGRFDFQDRFFSFHSERIRRFNRYG